MTVGKSWVGMNSVSNTGTYIAHPVHPVIIALFLGLLTVTGPKFRRITKADTFFYRDQLLEEMEEAFSNFRVRTFA